MKFESSNEDHIFSIEMYDDNASARHPSILLLFLSVVRL